MSVSISPRCVNQSWRILVGEAPETQRVSWYIGHGLCVIRNPGRGGPGGTGHGALQTLRRALLVGRRWMEHCVPMPRVKVQIEAAGLGGG